MKFHIVQAGETVSKILKKYNMSEEDFSALNPDYRYRKYEIGDRIRVKEESSDAKQIISNIGNIYSNNKINITDLEEQKYICPHCKNIIIIPK